MSPTEFRFSAQLMDKLRELGDNYGPFGVAIAAAELTDKSALIDRLESEVSDESEGKRSFQAGDR